MLSKWFTKRNVIILVCIILAMLFFFYIVPAALPILFALVTAMLIDPLVKLVEKKFKWTRQLSVISIFIFILVIISILLYFTVTSLIGKLIDFTKAAPEYFNTLSGVWIDIQNKLLQFTASLPAEVIIATQEETRIIFESMRTSILNLINYEKITMLLTNVPSFLVSLLVFIIALFLFMLELPELKKIFFQYLTKSTEKKVRFMVTKLNAIFFGFIKAQFLISIVIFIVSFIGLLMIKPEYAFVMSVIIWIIDLIPILGSIIILAPWALYYFVSGDVGLGTQLTLLAIVLLVLRRTIEPKVMSSQIGLKPLPTLIAMFIGLKVFGFLGFFIGPLIVILFTTAREANMIKLNFKI